MFYTYVLISEKDNKFYVGFTKDLKKRLKEHADSRVASTVLRRPLKLVYYEACLNEVDAISREKYFKTGFVDAESTDKNKKKLVDKSTEMLCLKEACFDFVKENKSFRIFKNNQDKYLGIVYADEGRLPFKKQAKRLNKQFIVYVFSLDESAREEEFEDIADLVELRPIPAVILNVYKRIFK